MHPDDLEFVKETAQERKWSTALLRDIRAEFVYNAVDVRPLEFLVSIGLNPFISPSA
ncbi:hypothetical protein F5880DRAFT_1619722 [Lentinula raphanica]|nr:hypothetical protein F5880DRAFT_1619722 [Lentinula raphanica]